MCHNLDMYENWMIVGLYYLNKIKREYSIAAILFQIPVCGMSGRPEVSFMWILIFCNIKKNCIILSNMFCDLVCFMTEIYLIKVHNFVGFHNVIVGRSVVCNSVPFQIGFDFLWKSCLTFSYLVIKFLKRQDNIQFTNKIKSYQQTNKQK